MSSNERTVIPARWLLEGTDRGPELRENRFVVVEGNTIAAIGDEPPADAGHTVATDEALVLPGFVNIHNHSFSAPLFRGLIDDLDEATIGGNFVYRVLLPIGKLAADELDPDEQRAIVELAFLDLLRTGSTTVVDMWRSNQEFFFDVAREMGIRVYGMPYQWSSANVGVDAGGRPTYDGSPGDTGLERAVEMFERHDEGADGRVRVGLGPHGVDTCSPDLLRAVRAAADELGCPITLHVSQSPLEPEVIRERHGKTSVEHLRDLGVLGPDVVAAHCIYATDADLEILREAGTTVATCPLTYARFGVTAPFFRFRRAGLKVGLGTDGYCLDMLTEIRASGLLSKTRTEQGEVASAHELIAAATSGGAAALGRSDIGVVAPGARADLVVVNMRRPHLYPVWDPLRALVWNGSGADVSTVMVDGEVLVRDGAYVRADADDIMERANRSLHKLWKMAEGRGLLERWPVAGDLR